MREVRVDHSLPAAPDRFKRLRDVLIECNFLINLVDDREQLLKGICHLLVDAGGFSRVWVRLTAEAAPGVAPEIAAQKKAHTILKDYYFACSKPARRSSIAASLTEPFLTLPLEDGQANLGVLTLYGPDQEPFDQQEIGLLAQLAANLALRLRLSPEPRRLQPGLPRQPIRPAWPGWAGADQAAQADRQPLINLLNG
jgi:hypothetical protein